jgi:hypothetical protein
MILIMVRKVRKVRSKPTLGPQLVIFWVVNYSGDPFAVHLQPSSNPLATISLASRYHLATISRASRSDPITDISQVPRSALATTCEHARIARPKARKYATIAISNA